MTDMIGKTLGEKYKIIRLVGRGGMGIVYEAEHLLLHKRVAVKVLLPMYASKTQQIRRFVREGQAASAIEHPNILEIKDLCQDPDGTMYIVMELLRGRSLKRLLEQRQVLPVAQAVNICLEVLSGLEAAHANGVIHRDLKPENIFLSARGGLEQVKIVDFGVAKFVETSASSLSLTATGAMPGTPYYMAPEQAKGGKHADEQTDIWALGVVMYEMLTGKMPFEGDNYNEVLSQILLAPLRPVQELSADVPEELAAVVHKALSKDKTQRYVSAWEMTEALLPVRASVGLVPRTTEVLGRSASPAVHGNVSADPSSADSADSDLMAMTISSPTMSRPSNRAWYVSAAVVLLIAGVSLFSFLRKDGDTMKQIQPFGEGLSAHAAAQAPPVLETNETNDEKAPVEDVSKVAAAPRTVTVNIQGLPYHASIAINGDPRELPLVLSKSEEQVTFRITAK